jgi:hypothetical protein
MTHRLVTESQIVTYELWLAGLAEYIERQSQIRLLPAPVKATKRARKVKV